MLLQPYNKLIFERFFIGNTLVYKDYIIKSKLDKEYNYPKQMC